MSKKKSSKPQLRYDNKGRPLKDKKYRRGFLRFFLGFLIPYLLINGGILFLVVTRPTLEAGEPDTTDYQTATVSFSVDSFLPLRTIEATVEGEKLELEKSGNTYTVNLNRNGNVMVYVESLNYMSSREYISVNILDETPPTVDEESIVMGAGYVEFTVSDSQAGMNYEGIYAVEEDGTQIKPTDINQAQGKITFSMTGEHLTVHVPDMVGNEQTLNISLN